MKTRLEMLMPQRRRSIGLPLWIALASMACAQAPDSSSGAPAPIASATLASAAAPSMGAQATNVEPGAQPSNPENSPPFHVQTDPFSDSKKAFDSAKALLLKDYYQAGITEDDLNRAAVRGMVEDIDARMYKWNKLLDPIELSSIENDLKGETVGIGIRLRFDSDTGHVAILGIIPGSPAEKAGLQAGDTIVSVDGKLFRGKVESDALRAMRGAAGTSVTVSVLRDDTIRPYTLTRAAVQLQETEHFVEGGIGYLRVAMFSAKTPSAVKAALAGMANVRGIVLDVRDNEGGSFDDAVKTAELFVPSGATIVVLERREGKKETLRSTSAPVVPAVPLAILIDHATSSGGELVAAAVSQHLHAKLVGHTTFGKWSMQSLETLGNGYAIKFTMALFSAPDGHSYDGVGLPPDVPVDETTADFEHALTLHKPIDRIAADVQLRTAISLLPR